MGAVDGDGRGLRPAALSVLGILLLTAMPVLPAAPVDEPSPVFSCALRFSPDGALYSTPVDFPLPELSSAEKSNLARGPYCNIINSSGRNIPYETVRSLDENFTQTIWPNDTAAFGTPPYSKIDIIIVSHDGMGGVAGYFSSSDPDAIYLDYDDLHVDLDVTAHEFQHLIHYSKDPSEAIWLNEGCSECGIYVCYGGGRPGLTSHFSAYGSGTDNSFIDWNTVSDYGGAALYTIYCYERFGGNDFTRALVADTADGVQSYNNRLAPKGESFESVFKKWIMANWLNNASVDSGEWGYRGVFNYVGHTFLEKSYPLSCSSRVDERWGADYIRFEPTVWNQLMGDLEINLTFTGGTGYCAVAMVGKVGGSVPDRVEVPAISGGRATALVPNLGGDYAVACVVISGLSGPVGYTYEARVVDITPPSTSISVVPSSPNGKNGWYTTPPTITLSVNEPGSAIYFAWDASPFERYNKSLRPPEGNHTLRYHSVDRAGNVEQEKSKCFLVDTIAPVTTASINPPEPTGQNGWYNSSAAVSLTCDTPEARTLWSWDNEPFSSYDGPVEILEGYHRFNYRSEDQAGNLETVRTLETRMDTIPPTVDIIVRPEKPDGLMGWYLRTPWINLSSSDPADPRIYYRWDDGPLEQYARDLKAPAGAHTLTYYAVDAAGNRGPAFSTVIKVDGSPPGVEALPEIPEPDGLNGWYITPFNITLIANETGNVTIFYRWDDGPMVQYGEPFPMPEGTHTLGWYGIDEAGNKGPDFSRAFRLDSVPPLTVASVVPRDVGTGWFHVRPKVTLSSEEGAVIQYSLDSGALLRYMRPIEIPEGRHTLSFFATDAAGNVEPRSERTFRVDTLPPAILLFNISRTKATTLDYIEISVTAEDDNGIQEYMYDFGDGSTSGWTNESRRIQRFPYPGTYLIKVRVRDGSGLESVSKELELTITAPPARSPGTGGPDILGFLSGLPPALYYLIAGLVALVIAGILVRRVLKERRRRRLYKEVERAEEERERRHTMELDELEATSLRRELAADPFGAPAGPPGSVAYTYDIAPGGAVVRWEESAPPPRPEPEYSTEPDFRGVKLWGQRTTVPAHEARGPAGRIPRPTTGAQSRPRSLLDEEIPEAPAEPIEPWPVAAPRQPTPPPQVRTQGPAWVSLEDRRPSIPALQPIGWSPRQPAQASVPTRAVPAATHHPAPPGPAKARPPSPAGRTRPEVDAAARSAPGDGYDELEAVLRRIREGK
ncbi:MAG: PKD domain-containing protein [Thermoplasmata archaeon]